MNKLARRLCGTIATLLIVSLITFVALSAAPGDAASGLVGDTADASQLAQVRAQMGLDQPLPLRYVAFLGGLILKGDLGNSLVSGRPVSGLLLERLPFTIALALVATALAAAIGGVIGTGAALRSGSFSDSFLMGGAAVSLAMPTFWTALLFMLLFSIRLHWLPVAGADGWQYFILPSLTLALPSAGVIARLMRSSLLDTLGADYVRTANGKGLAPGQVVSRHVVRNSLIPVVTVLGLHLGHLLGGAFVVETIFGMPGLGRLLVQAIFDRDLPVVMGATLLIAVVYVIINLMVDVAHGVLDPQIAHEAI